MEGQYSLMSFNLTPLLDSSALYKSILTTTKFILHKKRQNKLHYNTLKVPVLRTETKTS